MADPRIANDNPGPAELTADDGALHMYMMVSDAEGKAPALMLSIVVPAGGWHYAAACPHSGAGLN